MHKPNLKRGLALKILLTLFAIVHTNLTSVDGYKVEPPNYTHQYITNESQDTWKLIQPEIKQYLRNILGQANDDEDYNAGDDIITGSSEEDSKTNPLRHFWQPDTPNGGAYDDGLLVGFESSWERSYRYWEETV